MKIRSAQESDLKGIVSLQVESWRDIYSDVLSEEYLSGQIVEDLEKHWNTVKIRSEDVVLVAQENGILGFIAVWCQDEPYIDNLHIN
ncbi:MAG: hypothetical protein DRH93_15160 [Deltaproteobacteria bacterium]|nr:MAG: hypothetical protein DRH93_15160 [Deltaproteobacteria bacterium]